MDKSNGSAHLENDGDLWNEEDHIDFAELEQILDRTEPINEGLRIGDQYDGFDDNVGDTWIYPSNLPCRAYQQSIAQAALYRNTLVVLPTGLGKTFIAAVVMYNIYRWYPRGKVVFMAPTKPLVSQQILACQKIMPFPAQDTIDITGKVRRDKRIEYWRTKRVFFATPQAVLMDMSPQSELEQAFPFKDIKLVVVDEAHRAKGRYAYTEVVQLLSKNNRCFRVLALSATPGRKMEDVAEVVRNLFISHIEVRWDNSIDVVSYVHQRSLKTIVVKLDEKIKTIRDELVKIIDPYLRQLIEASAISSSHQHLTRNFLLFEQKRFQERSMHERHPQLSVINSNFSTCISLFHSLELLERHGLRVFLNSFDDDEEGRPKFVVALNPYLRDLVSRLRNELGPNPFDISAHNMTNGCLPEMPPDLDFGHPKFQHACECLLEHFNKNPESRAIVFCEYRESVMLIYRLLLQHVPLLQPRCFVGQGGTTGPLRALSQKQQLQIMQDFRSGKSNVLIATSIGEEGIDVGEVDLIVCFDISTSNPTRFIQRIGRTGRQRRGSVIMLVTEGKEQQILKEVLATKDQTNKKILNSTIIKSAYFQDCPRMVPSKFKPKCLQTLIKPPDPPENQIPAESSKSKMLKGGNTSQISMKNSKTHTQDLRKFLRKPVEDLDAEDSEMFEIPTESPYTPVTQRTAEKSMNKVKNIFKDLNMDSLSNSNTQLLRTQNPNPNPTVQKLDTKEIKKVNRLLKSTKDIVPVSQRNVSLLDKLKSSNFSRAGKLFTLKQNYSHVRQLFEQMDILQVLEEDSDNMSVEEHEVRQTCELIMKLFENDRRAVDRLLEDGEYEMQKKLQESANETSGAIDDFEMSMSTKRFENALVKIFDGLDQQGNSWDSFDYRLEELQKIHKETMDNNERESNKTNHDLNSVIFDAKSCDITTQFDDINITDSKYCSQFGDLIDESEIFKEFNAMAKQKQTNSSSQSNKPLNPSPISQVNNLRPYSQKHHKLPKQSTPLCSPLLMAFERQKDKQKSQKSFDTKLSNFSLNSDASTTIEIESDDDDYLCNVPIIHESPIKAVDKKTCDKTSISHINGTSFMSNVSFSFASPMHQKNCITSASSKNIEKDEPSPFVLCQQSTPIPKTIPTVPKSPVAIDKTLQQALEVDLEDFVDPFPEEFDFLTEKFPSSLSGSSVKENTKPSTSKNNYASDLFQLLEAKPTNSVMTPKATMKVTCQSRVASTPPPNSPTRAIPSKSISTPNAALADSPKCRLNTSLSLQKYETSPTVLTMYTQGLKRLETLRKRHAERSNRKPCDTASFSGSITASSQKADSPIIRKVRCRKILESDTESDEATTPVVMSRNNRNSRNSRNNRNSDSDFEEIHASPQAKRQCLPKRQCMPKIREIRLQRGSLCPFFDQEAEKCGGSGHTTEEDDDNSENSLANFVCDSTLAENDADDDGNNDNGPSATQMQAVYLQSVKSPFQRNGRFKIPERENKRTYDNVFSQAMPIEQSQYAVDSFVVSDEGEDTFHTTLCPLERAEKILKDQKRQARKRRFAEVGIVNPTKKHTRKCYQLQDDSDTPDGDG